MFTELKKKLTDKEETAKVKKENYRNDYDPPRATLVELLISKDYAETVNTP